MTTIERDFLIERGVQPARLHVIPPGVDPASVRGGDGRRLRDRLGLTDESIAFCLGANAYDKGTVHTVEAVRRLWQQGLRLTLVLGGPRLSHFDHYLATLPAIDRQRLHVLGPLSDDERRDLFAAGDLFVQPSRTDSFGISYLEAWACGKPVIGARAGGVPAVIRDGVDGMLVPFGDVVRLAQVIRELIEQPTRAAAFGQAGLSRIAEHSWLNSYRRIAALYAELITQARPAPEG
jgi:glycosyltransferase involved in cell wall biosynthesis